MRLKGVKDQVKRMLKEMEQSPDVKVLEVAATELPDEGEFYYDGFVVVGSMEGILYIGLGENCSEYGVSRNSDNLMEFLDKLIGDLLNRVNKGEFTEEYLMEGLIVEWADYETGLKAPIL